MVREGLGKQVFSMISVASALARRRQPGELLTATPCSCHSEVVPAGVAAEPSFSAASAALEVAHCGWSARHPLLSMELLQRMEVMEAMEQATQDKALRAAAA